MRDYLVDPATGGYVMTDGQIALCETLQNRVYLALGTELGTLVGDASFGSRLHELRRHKATEETLQFAMDEARSALQYLLDDGSAEALDVDGEWFRSPDQATKGVVLFIQVTQAGEVFPFHYFVPVG